MRKIEKMLRQQVEIVTVGYGPTHLTIIIIIMVRRLSFTQTQHLIQQLAVKTFKTFKI